MADARERVVVLDRVDAHLAAREVALVPARDESAVKHGQGCGV
ncbi:MAG: hypothetical protein ACYCX5_12865 [Coriobacteriia bacterium]